jgi:hypothetical protein
MFHYFGSNNPFSGIGVEKAWLHLCRTTQKRTIPSTTKIPCNAIRKRADVMRSQCHEMKHWLLSGWVGRGDSVTPSTAPHEESSFQRKDPRPIIKQQSVTGIDR